MSFSSMNLTETSPNERFAKNVDFVTSIKIISPLPHVLHASSIVLSTYDLVLRYSRNKCALGAE